MSSSSSNPAPIRALIADDHEIVREGLHLLLSENAEGITVVGQASNGQEVIALAAALQPDVILMDLFMPKIDGVEATRQLRVAGSPCRVIILTSSTEGGRVREALRAGAVGYLLKDVLQDELTRAIRAAAEGKATLHPAAQQQLVQEAAASAAPDPLAELTARETEVLQCIAAGRSNKEIGKDLSLTLGTVKGYVSAILAKLELADRTQAALFAVRHGLGPRKP